jgi:hypothetical protein
VNLLAEFRSEPAQVENVEGKSHFLKHRLGDLDQPPGLRHLPGAGLVAARKAIDQQDARRFASGIMNPLRGKNGFARRQPIQGYFIVRIGKARSGLARQRRFSRVAISIPAAATTASSSRCSGSKAGSTKRLR